MKEFRTNVPVLESTSENGELMHKRFSAVALLLLATHLEAVELATTTTRIVVDAPGTYDYAPSPTAGDIWLGRGIFIGDDNDPYHDAIVHFAPGVDRVELCPTAGGANDAQSIYTLCQNDFDPGPVTPSCTVDPDGYYPNPVMWDFGLVNDPSVVRGPNGYYLYFTAPRTGGCGYGVNNQIFLATSSDGIHWTKYPGPSQLPQPVIAFNELPYGKPGYGTTDRYGIGESSVVYKDGVFYMYYTYKPWWSSSTVMRARSYDGINFWGHERVFAEATAPGNEALGVDVKYIRGWDLWLMVQPGPDRTALTWNISRDGVHWLPYGWTPAGAAPRRITTNRGYAIVPALDHDGWGMISDATLAGSKAATVMFTGGDASNDYLNWRIDAADVILTIQSAYGYLDGVSADAIATGWSYDPDTGTNDAAANGGASSALDHDTWVRAVVTSTTTGARYEGSWQSAALARPDLVSAGVAPDQYHGFSINLKTQGFPSGTYYVRVEAGEFPTGMGATLLANQFTVTLP